jgi:hypothetical protein
MIGIASDDGAKRNSIGVWVFGIRYRENGERDCLSQVNYITKHRVFPGIYKVRPCQTYFFRRVALPIRKELPPPRKFDSTRFQFYFFMIHISSNIEAHKVGYNASCIQFARRL